MALTAFDVKKHAVGLGTSDPTTMYGFQLIPGSYRRRVQERSSRRIQVGATRWLQDDKVSEWQSNDFSGGAYQDVLEDPKMFSSCFSMLPSKRNPRSLRTCQSVEMMTTNGTTLINNTNYTGLGTVVAWAEGWGKLWLIGSDDKCYCITPTTEGRATVTVYDWAITGADIQAVTCNRSIGVIVVGYSNGRVREYTQQTPATLWREFQWDSQTMTGLATRHKTVLALGFYGNKVIVGMKNRIFYYDADNTDTTGSGASGGHATACPWTMLGDASEDYIKSFTNHSGQLYILSNTGTAATAIDVTTLTAGVLPWQRVPYMFYGTQLVSYAGRLYLGGYGQDAESNGIYAQLFEMTGNQFRELRAWYDAASTLVGGSGYMAAIYCMAVFEGQLFMGNGNAKALEAYDFTTDAFFTAYGANSTYSAFHPYHLFPVGSQFLLHAGGNSGQRGLYYIPRAHKANCQPYVITSEFCLEPGVLKKWTTVQVHSRFGQVGLKVSTDGGLNWTPIYTYTSAGSGYNYVRTFTLHDSLAASETIKLRVEPETTNDMGATNYYFREVVEIVVGFVMCPPRLRMWDMGIVLADNLEALDGTMETGRDAETDAAQFWSWYDAGTVLYLRDRDGVSRKVMITNIQENEPAMGAAVGVETKPQREVFITISLAEVA